MGRTFEVWDYLVFGLMLVVSVCIGIYHAVRGRNQNTSEYLVAGRYMTFLPLAMSMIATSHSSIMMLGMPAESYVYGISWILGELGTNFGFILDTLLVLTFVQRMDLSTPFEYYERRFKSRRLRIFANVVFCISILRYMSIILYAQGIALQTVTGLSIYSSIVLTAGSAVIYTTIGGLKAVIWTDVLQFFLMFSGLLAVTIMGTVQVGGPSEVFSRAAASGRLDFSLDTDPTVRHTVWNLFFGQILVGSAYVVNPPTLQRISSSKSLKDSRIALLLSIPGYVALVSLGLVEGLVAYAYFSYKGCDPLESKQIESPNQIVPFFVMDLFQNMPGMPGLFLASLFSASLSTISSCLSAIANITWHDLVQPRFTNMSVFRGLLVVKTTVVVFGALGGVFAIAISLIGSRTLNQISYMVHAVFGAPLNTLFYLGAFFPFVNTKGALTGFITGTLFMAWLLVGSMYLSDGSTTPYSPLGSTGQCPVTNVTDLYMNSTSLLTTTTSLYTTVATAENITASSTRSGLDVFYNTSYTLYTTMAMLVVLGVGIVTSLLTGGWKTRADPEVVIQKSDILFWSRPGRCRSRNHYNVAQKMSETEDQEEYYFPTSDINRNGKMEEAIALT